MEKTGWDWNTNSTKIWTQTNIVVSLLCSYFSHWCCVESNGVRISDCLKYEHSSNLNVVKLVCYFRIRMEGLLNLIHDLKCFTYSPRINFSVFYFQVGFLCIIVAPWRGKQFFMARPFDHINMMLVRWLLFRMMFASGVVKLTSQCPTWWGLTAMPTHYVLWPLLWSLKELKWLVIVFYP